MSYLVMVIVLLLPVVVEAKEVVIPYKDFLTMVSTVEHKEKLLKQCAAEREILVKLNDENGTVKRLNAQQIEAMAGELEAREQLGETQEQIAQAIQSELLSVTKRLSREQRLSRYKSEAFWLGLVAVGLGVMN